MNDSKYYEHKIIDHICKTDHPVVLCCLTPKAIKMYADEVGVDHKHVRSMIRKAEKVDRGCYDLRMIQHC